MPNLDRIEINPKVMMGKPVVKGTRIPVDLILRKLGEGFFSDEVRIKALSTAAVQNR